MRIRQNNGKRSFWDESDILTFWNDKQTSKLEKIAYGVINEKIKGGPTK